MDDNFQLLLHESRGDVLVLALTGDVDMATAAPVKEAVATAVASGSYRRIVFDLTQVSFMDSSGIHILVDTQRKMQAAGGEVKVVNSSRNLARIFEMTGLDRLLTILPDRQSALAAVA